MGWVFNATSRPLYPRERPGTHCIGDCVGHGTDLDWCGKSRRPPGFHLRTVQPAASHYTDWAIRPVFEPGVCDFVGTCIRNFPKDFVGWFLFYGNLSEHSDRSTLFCVFLFSLLLPISPLILVPPIPLCFILYYSLPNFVLSLLFCVPCNFPLVSPCAFFSTLLFPFCSLSLLFCVPCSFPLVSPYAFFSPLLFPFCSLSLLFCVPCSFPLVSPYAFFSTLLFPILFSVAISLCSLQFSIPIFCHVHVPFPLRPFRFSSVLLSVSH